jgi:hypothetical protein
VEGHGRSGRPGARAWGGSTTGANDMWARQAERVVSGRARASDLKSSVGWGRDLSLCRLSERGAGCGIAATNRAAGHDQVVGACRGGTPR